MIAIWLGTAPPVRSVRWLDGALAATAKFDDAIALAAGDPNWLDLASDRANRAGIPSVGVPTDLQLDYLGWAQVVAAAVKQLAATMVATRARPTVIVDEASRPERFPEVAAIAELLDAVQLTHVVAIAPETDVIHASRVTGRQLQTVRVRGPAVIGVRIAGPHVDEYPTPMPSVSMRRLELAAIGLDPVVLGHRSLPQRAPVETRKTVERIADHLLVHLAPRGAR